jgi:hypothetical protein
MSVIGAGASGAIGQRLGPRLVAAGIDCDRWQGTVSLPLGWVDFRVAVTPGLAPDFALPCGGYGTPEMVPQPLAAMSYPVPPEQRLSPASGPPSS